MQKTWTVQLKDTEQKKLKVGLKLSYTLTDREVRVLSIAVELGGQNLFSIKNKRYIQKELGYKNVTGVTAVVNVIKQKRAIEFKSHPRRYELASGLQAFLQADKHVFEWVKM